MTISLLREIDDLGAPRDWLLARLRGRRARLLNQPLASDPWSVALAEGRWLYPRCDRSWRRQCAPLLALLEVRRLGSALRFCQGGDRPAAAAALAGSLLCAPLLHLLEAELTPDGRLRALAQLPQIRSLLGPAGEV